MKLFTREMCIALDIMQILYREGGVVTSIDMADELLESWDFLQQVVRRLRLKGMITTQRGVGGGIRLTPMAEHMTLATFMEKMGKPLNPSVAPTSQASVKAQAMYDHYGSVITLKHLFEEESTSAAVAASNVWEQVQ